MENVKFIDNSKEVIDTLKGLSKTALRKAGKFAGQKLKDNTAVRTARLQNTVGYWAKIDRKTGQPELQIGYFSKTNAKKKGRKVPFVSPHWLEFGVKPHLILVKKASTLTDGVHDFGRKVQHTGISGKNTLRNTILNNIEAIKNEQKEALAQLNQEIEKAKGYIEESEDDEIV